MYYDKNIDDILAVLPEDKKNLTTDELVDSGLYKVVELPIENRMDVLYSYKQTGKIVGSEYHISYVPVPKDIANVKNNILTEIKMFFKGLTRPKIEVTLSNGSVVYIDGGREDLENFNIGKELGLTAIRDVYNNLHNVESSDYDTIINEIKHVGLTIIQTKWELEDQLKTASAFEDVLNAYNTFNDFKQTIQEKT